MTLTLNIPPEVESKIRERAAASGQALDQYAAQLLVDAVSTATPGELPARKRVAEAESPGEAFAEVIGKGKALPKDGSVQHDHYIYGTAKR